MLQNLKKNKHFSTRMSQDREKNINQSLYRKHKQDGDMYLPVNNHHSKHRKYMEEKIKEKMNYQI